MEHQKLWIRWRRISEALDFSMIDEIGKKEDLIRLFVAMWAIWHAKQKAIHEDHYQSPMATMAFVKQVH
jgi:hypothetical protein